MVNIKNCQYIHGNRCWINGQFQEATIHIENGKIKAILEGKQVIKGIPFESYDDQIIMPGIIDPHVHINEPGRTDWEGFETGTKAAALGGITTIVDMPLNSSPVTTNATAFQQKIAAAKEKLLINCGFWGGVVPQNSENSKDLEDLLQAGVLGIKGFLTHSGIDEFPNVNQEQLEKIMPLLVKYDVPLLLHCELESPVPNLKKEATSYQSYLASRPQKWEIDAIELAIDLQKKYDARVHIVHLSATDALPIINARKQATDLLTVETCPQYLYFQAENIPDAAPIYKCAPPIREKANNDRLWKAVCDGEIDFIGSDHSPAPPEIKQLESGDLFKAWGGIAGLQFTLPALWTSGKEKGLTLEKMIPLLTSHPAQFVGLGNKGQIKEGYDADITIWDEKATFTVTKDIIAHRHKATPYLDGKFSGKVSTTFVNGEKVVDKGVIIDHLPFTSGQLLLTINHLLSQSTIFNNLIIQ